MGFTWPANQPPLLKFDRLLETYLAYAPRGFVSFAKAMPAESASIEGLAGLFQAGDPHARALVLEAGRFLGIAVASLVGVLNVRKIVLSGIPALFGEPFLEAVTGEMRQRILPDQARETQVSNSSIGEDIVIQGACALVLRRELNLPPYAEIITLALRGET